MRASARSTRVGLLSMSIPRSSAPLPSVACRWAPVTAPSTPLRASSARTPVPTARAHAVSGRQATAAPLTGGSPPGRTPAAMWRHPSRRKTPAPRLVQGKYHVDRIPNADTQGRRLLRSLELSVREQPSSIGRPTDGMPLKSLRGRFELSRRGAEGARRRVRPLRDEVGIRQRVEAQHHVAALGEEIDATDWKMAVDLTKPA